MRIKTFWRATTKLEDKRINDFLDSHDVVEIDTNVTPGFSYPSTNGFYQKNIVPLVITTIIYKGCNEKEIN